jgi:predicted PilT family ATPase
MTSYTLNSSTTPSATKEDIPLIIGKGAKGIKGVISKSWNMYDRFQNSPNKVEEEKPKLKIILKPHEQSNDIIVTIESQSEIMTKLAQKNLNNYIKFIKQKQVKNNPPHEIIIELDHRLIGKLIGKKASNLNNIKSETIDNYLDSVENSEDDEDSLDTIRINVSELDFKTTQEIIDYSKSSNKTFLGWQPEPEQEYTEHISIKVTFKYGTKLLTNRSQFIESIERIIADKIHNIKNDDRREMDEINEFLEL